jgi:hypothetical protein
MKAFLYLLVAIAVLPAIQGCPAGDDYFDLVFTSGVAADDLDQDGEVDIVLAISDDDRSADQHQGVVFRNQGSVRNDFSITQRLNLQGGKYDRPGKVLLGDLDDDGFSDIAIGNGVTVYICLQSAASPGRFSAPRPVGSGSYLEVLAIADLNNDGVNDLAVSTGARQLAIHFQDSMSPGTFLPRVDLGIDAIAVAVGDLDGDMINDIALIDAGSDSIKILLQDAGSAGSFALAQEFGDGSRLKAIRVADLDRDGRQDLAAVYSGDVNLGIRGGVSVRLQDPVIPGRFPSVVEYISDSNGLGFAIGDLNDDGLPDVAITAHPYAKSVRISLLFQDAADPGNFLAPVKLDSVGYPYDIAIADLDGDLLNDLVIADGALEIRYQRGGAPGTFTGRFEVYNPN